MVDQPVEEPGNLGILAKTRGDLDAARGYWRRSVDLFAEIGVPHMVERVQGWIDGLDAGGQLPP